MPARSPNRAVRFHVPKASATLPLGAGSTIGVAVAAALATVAATRARALDAAAADVSSSGGLQEVIVSARKRDENLQTVPISIDVFTQKDVQNLGITGFDDYATKVPSISFISIGPGTQTFFMRGVSDGSNPNYANSSATGFFLDDNSLSWYGVQPDLHLYDIERIEVLNGPQGTTFGAGSMAGAVRYITNKPDLRSFSAGADLDGGKIEWGRTNQTYEAFLNMPLISDTLGLRLSAFSASHGGFINNKLVTRTWKNGTVSNNAQWARDDFNREHQEGGRIALKWAISEKWTALFTSDYQRTHAFGAWDEDPTVAPRTVERFGPEELGNEAKLWEARLDGDVGIADLVFASTYWSLPTRRWDEYSQYQENFAPSYTPFFHNGAPAGSQEEFSCLSGPAYGGTPFIGCNVPLQYYEYHTNPVRWADELRLTSKTGGRFHWLAGLYWEKTTDKNYGSPYYEPGLRTDGAAFQYELYYYHTTASSLPPGVWFDYKERSDYLQTTEFANINFDVTPRFNVEAGVVHFHSDFKYAGPYSQFAYNAVSPFFSDGSSRKWNARFGMNYKPTDTVMLYATFAQGFRDGGSNIGAVPDSCIASGVPPTYVPDTLNNYEIGWKTTWLSGRLLWNGALYDMEWKNLQTLIFDVNICPSSSFNANVGNARVYGAESNVDYKVSDNWTFQASVSYTDSHLITVPNDPAFELFRANVGERLPFVPYFNYSWNLRYEHPLTAHLRGYGQFDLAHKGDMWDDLHVVGSNGFPRILQPSYTIMNLRFGLTPEDSRWQAELYVTNLADKNAIIYTNTGNFDLRQTTNEPRVYGLRLNYRWGKVTGGE